MSTRLKNSSFIINMMISRIGKEVKIRKGTLHRDTDRGSSYVTYDSTITTEALVSNVSGYVEIVYPFGKAYEGDYMMIFKSDEDIDDRVDRILYNDKEYKINEYNDREDFIELVVERC